MAVSGLSPVSTHTTMPASSNARIVCGTFSCSLSSTPVAPTNVSALSNRAKESRKRFSRPTEEKKGTLKYHDKNRIVKGTIEDRFFKSARLFKGISRFKDNILCDTEKIIFSYRIFCLYAH